MGTHPIFESDFDCLTDLSDLREMADEENLEEHLLDYDEVQSSSARPSPEWERRPFSSSPRSSRLNHKTARSPFSSCATPENSRFKSPKSTNDSQSTWTASRWRCFSVGCRSKRTRKC